MTLRCYTPKKFRGNSPFLIAKADEICSDLKAQGYDITLRQLYYQFVSRDLIPNTQQSYKALGSVINDARLAGALSWDYLEDRTRNLQGLPSWSSPQSIISTAAAQYREDCWRNQPYHVEVWVEKEALAGIVARAANEVEVDYFSCRGYVSQSEMHDAATRLGAKLEEGKRVVVLHLGDHDPSGIDMTRDIRDRLTLFMGGDWAFDHSGSHFDDEGISLDEAEEELDYDAAEHVDSTDHDSLRDESVDDPYDADEVYGADVGDNPLEVRRIALNYDQVQRYQPPPNPAKITDSRAKGYIAQYGRESWELDALEPQVINDLIVSNVLPLRDEDIWERDSAFAEERKEALRWTSGNWGLVQSLAGADGEKLARVRELLA